MPFKTQIDQLKFISLMPDVQPLTLPQSDLARCVDEQWCSVFDRPAKSVDTWPEPARDVTDSSRCIDLKVRMGLKVSLPTSASSPVYYLFFQRFQKDAVKFKFLGKKLRNAFSGFFVFIFRRWYQIIIMLNYFNIKRN